MLTIALPGSDFSLDYVDVREDRVVLYGSVYAELGERSLEVSLILAATIARLNEIRTRAEPRCELKRWPKNGQLVCGRGRFVGA
jgi:hypothetical protein